MTQRTSPATAEHHAVACCGRGPPQGVGTTARSAKSSVTARRGSEPHEGRPP
jgi:hypothetical protein